MGGEVHHDGEAVMTTATYDSRCYDLAELFLLELPGSTENDMIELAIVIQRACEEACSAVEAREGEGPKGGA